MRDGCHPFSGETHVTLFKEGDANIYVGKNLPLREEISMRQDFDGKFHNKVYGNEGERIYTYKVEIETIKFIIVIVTFPAADNKPDKTVKLHKL